MTVKIYTFNVALRGQESKFPRDGAQQRPDRSVVLRSAKVENPSPRLLPDTRLRRNNFRDGTRSEGKELLIAPGGCYDWGARPSLAAGLTASETGRVNTTASTIGVSCCAIGFTLERSNEWNDLLRTVSQVLTRRIGNEALTLTGRLATRQNKGASWDRCGHPDGRISLKPLMAHVDAGLLFTALSAREVLSFTIAAQEKLPFQRPIPERRVSPNATIHYATSKFTGTSCHFGEGSYVRF